MHLLPRPAGRPRAVYDHHIRHAQSLRPVAARLYHIRTNGCDGAPCESGNLRRCGLLLPGAYLRRRSMQLSGKKIAIVATHGFEQSELEVPRDRLKEAGAKVDIVAPQKGEIR